MLNRFQNILKSMPFVSIVLFYFCGVSFASTLVASYANSTVISSGSYSTDTTYISIAVNRNGIVNACYYEESSGLIKYTTNFTVSKTAQNVNEPGNYNSISPLVLDNFGNAYLSYYDKDKKILKVSTNRSGAWITEEVETMADGDISSSSIAVDGHSNIHIIYTYFRSLSGILKHATKLPNTWEFSDIDSIAYGGGTPSMAVDKFNAIHVAYSKGFYAGLKYATNLSGQWISKDVDSSGRVGLHSSIAIDKSGFAHISYYDDSHWALKYASNSSGTWSYEIVDSSNHGGNHTSLLLDDYGKVHISYLNAYPDQWGYFKQYYVKYGSNDTGKWQASTINDNLSQATYTSIAMDRFGKIYIGYVNNADAPSCATRLTKSAIGDVDLDGNITMADLILTLKVVSGFFENSTVNTISDVNYYNKIGIPQAIFIIKHITGLDQQTNDKVFAN